MGAPAKGLPPPPTEDDCCHGGCIPCVWDVYYEAVVAAEEEGDGSINTTANIAVRTVGNADAVGADPFDRPQNCVRIVPVEEDDDDGDSDENGAARAPPPPARPYADLAPARVLRAETFGVLRSVALDADLATLPEGVATTPPAGGGGAAAPASPAYLPVFVPNTDTRVADVMQALGWDERLVKIAPNVFSAGIDAPTYPYWIPQNQALLVSEVLKQYVDLTSRASVRQQVLWVMAEFATDAEEKAALTHLASREGVAEYCARFRAAGGEHYDFLTLLKEFPSARPPLGRVLAALPQLRARLFSNAAGPADSVELLIAAPPRGKGHASSFLREVALGAAVFIGGPAPPGPSGTLFHHMPPPTRDMVFVSNGSGAAGFLGYLRGLQEHRTGAGEVTRPHLAWYHGCRGEADVPYPEELPTLVSAFHVAFSSKPWAAALEATDGPFDVVDGDAIIPFNVPGADRYVWGLLWRDRMRLREALWGGGAVCICGSPAMVRDTRAVLQRVVGGDVFQTMVEEGRVVIEKWGSA